MTSAAAARIAPRFPDLLRGWRKVRKLSQWNLALTAGVSQRHLSFLESGRSSPSRDMVMLLAGALELPLREQNALLNAAGFANVYGHTGINQQELKQARHALSVMLEYHEPYPAIVLDRNWNILMTNAANTRVFSQFVDPATVWSDIGTGKAPNIMRVTLHSRGLKPYIANWGEFAAYFVHQLAQELATNPYNSEARELLDEIRDYPDMPDPHIAPRGYRPFLSLELEKGETRFEFFSMISTFGTPLDVTLQEIRIETFFPGNEQTEQAIRSLGTTARDS